MTIKITMNNDRTTSQHLLISLQLSNTKGAKSSPSHASDILIKPSLVYDLPSNPKMAIVADVDGDYQNEIVICYSDRSVRIFRFKGCQQLGNGMLNVHNKFRHSFSQ